MVAITHLPSRSLAGPRRRPVPTAATYRRRRLVALALSLLLVASLVWSAARLGTPAGSGTASFDARPVATHAVVVASGDSVWSIASELAGDGDIRPVVDAIVAANGGADLVAGQRLEIVLP